MQRRRATTLKAGAKLKLNGRERDRIRKQRIEKLKTSENHTEKINKSDQDRTEEHFIVQII